MQKALEIAALQRKWSFRVAFGSPWLCSGTVSAPSQVQMSQQSGSDACRNLLTAWQFSELIEDGSG